MTLIILDNKVNPLSQGEDNILVPIHAYPVMDVSKFPRMVTFPLTPVGESHTKSFALECSVPTDFEFQLSCLQSHPAFTVAPMQGRRGLVI